MTCPYCTYQNLPAATFCVNCGRSLARPQTSLPPRQPEAERRFVTVLFADLSGFTALSETRDPEAVRELVNACFDRLVPIIENHQGTVDQFVGDALVALFGAPQAHEDDPAQACRAALGMMQAIQDVNAELHLTLGLHIGINSGMVLAGGIGSRGRQQYSVLGDAVNLASRLQDAAEQGEIFVGAETYKLTREHFEFVSRGTMPFKGKSEPQAVWQLTRVQDDAPAHRRISTATPMMGRERELALLKRATRELWNEDTSLHVVSILGDAGVGKSRLVQEWCEAQAQINTSMPPQFVLAACAPDSATRAYGLLGEIARALRDDTTTVAAAPLTALFGQGDAAPAFETEDSAALQTRYANALRDEFAARASAAPIILICEDMHWADGPSLKALERALGDLVDTRVLIAFTSRLERETPGWRIMGTLQELPGASAVRLHLTPLAENDASALLAALLPGELPTEIQHLILNQAEGNPLFVQELVRMLLDRGDLDRVQERWTFSRDHVALDVPNTLQGVLMTRIDQVPPDARRVLQIASVLGREFPLAVLQEMLKRLDATGQ